jgi:DNA-binding NarL/FixJ family response regulator
VGVPTVQAHVTHVLTKLGLASRTQIALLAHDAGLA